MGISRKYFKDHNLMLTKVFGELDGKTLMQHVMILNKEVEQVFNLKEFADCREVTSVQALSTQMVTMSAASEKNKPGSKLAILTTKDRDAFYGMANAYRMFAEEHRESVATFRDLQEALNWLSDSDLDVGSLNALVNDANH